MIAVGLAAGVAMLLALVGTPVLIRWLQARGIGQQIREEGPRGHVEKAGTPTMGGVMIVGSAMVGYAVAHVRPQTPYSRGGLLVFMAIAGAGLVGLVDDYLKVSRRRSLGLNKRGKIAGQLAVAAAFALLAHRWAAARTNLAFTRFDSLGVDLGVALWTVLAILLILGASNAVNLTDGLDGLAAGSSAFSFAAFVVICFWQFRHVDLYRVPQALDLSLVAAAMLGACAGFLWWNAAPARIFMGDTGALAIGAGVGALAVLSNTHLLLPVIGGLFVVETLSVIAQVVAFRVFGRRVLRMAPIHHHFELLGWPETTVIVRFWILAGMFTAVALGIFYADSIRAGVAG
jgi:phospho-N-acetylmuramoyl-pentapeptide-transferase